MGTEEDGLIWQVISKGADTSFLKLKVVYAKLFPDDNFQEGAHDPYADSRATMRIFKEHYIQNYANLKSVLCYDNNVNPVAAGEVEDWD